MRKTWDKLGLTLSSLCLFHCLLLSLFPLILPAFSEYFGSLWFHIGFAILILGVSPLAFVPGFRVHGLTRVLYLAMTGLILIFGGLVLEVLNVESISHSVTVLGSLFLVYAHYLNLKHSKRNCC